MSCHTALVAVFLAVSASAAPARAQVPPVDCPVGITVQIDNGDPGYSETGDDWATWGSAGQAIGPDYRYLSKTVGGADKTGTATWEPALPHAGMYEVSATFRATYNRSSDANYFVHAADGSVVETVVDQQDGAEGEDDAHGPVYADLGTHYFEPGSGYVLLDGTDDNESDAADAVVWKLVSCSAEVEPPPPPPDPCLAPVDGGPAVTQLRYATVVADADGWTAEANATGVPDGKLAHNENLNQGETLTASGFAPCDPEGHERIVTVRLGVRAKMQYDTGKYQLVARIGTQGVSVTFSQTTLEWVDVNVTALHSAWTWADVEALQARLSLHDHPGGFEDSDIWADAFRLQVGLEACPPGVEKVCQDGDVVWLDGCGNTEGAVESCEDGDPCTVDSCDAGGCLHAPSDAVECQPIDPGPVDPPPPPPTSGDQCVAKGGVLCLGGVLWETDACGRVRGLADACDDGDPCTVDGCAPFANVCTHEALSGAACQACLPYAGKWCDPVAPVALWVDSCGAPKEFAYSCDDGNACTDDACDSGTLSCVHASVASKECESCVPMISSVCAGDRSLWLDSCGVAGGIAEVCNDGDPCTVDSCDGASGRCRYEPAGAGCESACAPEQSRLCRGGRVLWVDSCGALGDVAEACDDGDPCTVDGCSASTLLCTHDVPSVPCERGALQWPYRGPPKRSSSHREDATGCAAASGSGGEVAWWLLPLVWLALRRRRSRSLEERCSTGDSRSPAG